MVNTNLQALETSASAYALSLPLALCLSPVSLLHPAAGRSTSRGMIPSQREHLPGNWMLAKKKKEFVSFKKRAPPPPHSSVIMTEQGGYPHSCLYIWSCTQSLAGTFPSDFCHDQMCLKLTMFPFTYTAGLYLNLWGYQTNWQIKLGRSNPTLSAQRWN